MYISVGITDINKYIKAIYSSLSGLSAPMVCSNDRRRCCVADDTRARASRSSYDSNKYYHRL